MGDAPALVISASVPSDVALDESLRVGEAGLADNT